MSADAVIRAAVYNRVSTREQAEEGHNLKGDTERCLARIEREPDWEHVATYEDGGRQGDDPTRPEYQRLLTDVAASKVDVIVIPALDRFGRDSIEIQTKLALFDREGVRVVSLLESIDRDTPEGRLQTGILAQFAEFEKAKIRSRTKNGIAARARVSGKPWGAPAYGYQKTPSGHWEPAPAERDVYVRIFNDRVEHGMSKNGIAAKLTRDGVPTRHGARAWSASVVSRILRGREGLGEYHHGGEWHAGRHEKLISEDVWNRAQRMDAQGRKYAPGARGRLPKRHLFVRGMLRCVCGEAMLPRSDSDAYICRAHKADSTRCPVPPLRRASTDGAALAMFESASLDLQATRRHVEQQLREQESTTRGLLERAEQEAATAAERLRRVQRAFQDGKIEPEDWAEQRPDLLAERDAAQAAVARLRDREAEVAAQISDVDADGETLRRLADLRRAVAGEVTGRSADVSALRAALAAVISEVRLRDDGYVRDAIRADVNAMTRGEMPEPEGVPYGRVGSGYVLDFYGTWEQVAIGFDVPANNRTGSGVPEYPALIGPPFRR